MKSIEKISNRKYDAALFCGMLGCLCFGSGDWLMMYGNTAHSGSLYWLTEGVANIPAWRNTLAMALAFPGIILYGIALFAIADCILQEKQRRIYKILTTFGLTPWLCLHLFYIVILYLFMWLSQNGYTDTAIPAAEALYQHFSWLPLASQVLMIPPFLYLIYLQAAGKTKYRRLTALCNILVFYAVLYIIKSFLPDSAFRIGFTNGLMSESMILWFALMIFYERKWKNSNFNTINMEEKR